MPQMTKTLNIRVDEETQNKLRWLSQLVGWPVSFIIRLLIRRAKPSDFGIEQTERANDTA